MKRNTLQRALGNKLGLTYSAAILLGLVIFAIIAVITIDRTLRAGTDTHLVTIAQAAGDIVDVRDGRLAFDADDRAQIATILGAQFNGAVFGLAGETVYSSASHPPAEIRGAVGSAAARYFSAGTGADAQRAYVLPVVRGGKRLGTIVAWRATAWIDETDRGTLIAFGAAALLIALLAFWVGGMVARRALADAFARQRRFTADASHELRAPLAVIRAEADLALRRERPPQEYRDALAAIAAEADRVEMLIGDLLAAARAESGHLKIECIDLAVLCAGVCMRMRAAAEIKGVTIDLDTPERVTVDGDAAALSRALLALVHNAVKFAREGGRVVVRAETSADHAEIVVYDDGPGFSTTALRHAFERFWREEAARDREGTGLGLATAKAIVESLGGRISLGNHAAGGAEVRCRLVPSN